MTEERNKAPKLLWLFWVGMILLATISFAVVGVAHKYLVQPQEAGWGEGGPAAWEIPLSIGEGSTRYAEPLDMAVRRINAQVGCELLVRDYGNPTVLIVEGAIEVGTISKDWGASTWRAQDWSRGEIVIHHPLMVGTDLRVIWHEIGHLFNLAHDRAWAMKAITEESIGGPMVVPRFSDKDADLLLGEFCDTTLIAPSPVGIIQ